MSVLVFAESSELETLKRVKSLSEQYEGAVLMPGRSRWSVYGSTISHYFYNRPSLFHIAPYKLARPLTQTSKEGSRDTVMIIKHLSLLYGSTYET